jgi:hypothetical protein
MSPAAERGMWLPVADDRANLAAFVERALRLDDAAVIRVRLRSPDVIVAWAATGFDVLACRVVSGSVRPTDICVGADQLIGGLAMPGASGFVNTGFPMDSAWRAALPPDAGFVHVDDVPAEAVLELAQRGAEVSKEQGVQGPPVSLLDQEVINASGAGITIGIPMRCLFALTAMGFVDANGVVRVRTFRSWLRIDAPFGSVYYRRQLLRLV